MLQIKRKRFRGSGGSRYRESPKWVRSLRKVLVTLTVLILLFVGAGLGLTYYNGQTSPPPKAIAVPKPTPAQARHTPSPTGQIGSTVQYITTPVLPGDNASITIHTNANANCQITVQMANFNLPMKDSGLIPKKADDMGLVTWGWKIPADLLPGKGKATVICANLKNSIMSIGNFEVVKIMPSPAVTE